MSEREQGKSIKDQGRNFSFLPSAFTGVSAGGILVGRGCNLSV
jgi:hypothetical protein